MKKNRVVATDSSGLRRRAEERLRQSQPKNEDLTLSPGDMQRLVHELSVHQIELEMQQEELLQSRDELEHALERYTRLYDFAPAGYLTLTADGTILEANLRATTMLGVDRSLLKGARLGMFVAPEDIHVFHALMERVFSHQEPGYCDVMLFCEDASLAIRRIVHLHAVVQDDGHSCWTVLSDVTRQKQIECEHAALQATLVQVQKMESIGRLAGGVAHDFNNMLQVQLGNLELLLSTGELNESVRLILSDLQNSVMKSAGIVRQLLAFARKQIIRPRVLDFNAAITNILSMLGRILGEHVKLIFTSGEGLWPVKMDAVQIDQIITNLALNARDAIKERGTLFIATHNVTVDALFCKCHPEIVPGDYVLLEVRDDGAGMEKNVLDLVFEPFFTTKSMTEGAGLGLAVVYGIVRQNNGAVLANSIKGAGTTFEIYLPRSVTDLSSPLSGAADKVPGGDETILVVDDENSLRDLIGILLESVGYRVLLAGSAAEALSLSDAHPGTVQLLITDMMMPGMNGRELAREMIGVRPDIKTLLVSGYLADSLEVTGDSKSPVLPFLGKPFSRVQLARKVRELLDATAQ